MFPSLLIRIHEGMLFPLKEIQLGTVEQKENATLHLSGEEEAQAQRAATTDPVGCRRQKPLIPVTF